MHGPQRDMFIHRRYAVIDSELCIGCTLCVKICPLHEAIKMVDGTRKATITDPYKCAGCLNCVSRCPAKAINFVEMKASGN